MWLSVYFHSYLLVLSYRAIMSQKDGKMGGYPQGPPPPYQPYPNPSFGDTYQSPYPVAGGVCYNFIRECLIVL